MEEKILESLVEVSNLSKVLRLLLKERLENIVRKCIRWKIFSEQLFNDFKEFKRFAELLRID